MKIFYHATLTSILRHLTLSPSKSATLGDFLQNKTAAAICDSRLND